MGEFAAGKTAIGIVVYFVLFGIIITGVNNGMSISGKDLIASTNDGTSWTVNTVGTQCTTPRTYVTTSGEVKEGKPRSVACVRTEGLLDETVCDTINGCTWVNATTYFFGIFETNAICSGQINESFYNDDNDTLGLFESVCKLDDAQDNRSLCENIGCTFASVDTGDITHKTIIDMFSSLYAFDVDFGFETQTANNTLTIILIYLPTLVLLVCVYFMLPIIH